MTREAWLLALLTALLALGLLAGLRVWHGQRQASFRALAAELGLAWVAADDVALRQQLAVFALFAPVAASRADGLLVGSYDGVPVRVLNYDYGNFISSGYTPYLVVLFAVESPQLALEFSLRPRQSLNSLKPAGRLIRWRASRSWPPTSRPATLTARYWRTSPDWSARAAGRRRLCGVGR